MGVSARSIAVVLLFVASANLPVRAADGGVTESSSADSTIEYATQSTAPETAVVEPDDDMYVGDPEEPSAESSVDKSSLQSVIEHVFEDGRRRNIRQQVMQSVWRPYFLDDEDVNSFMVLLSRKSLETRWLRDRYFYASIEKIDEDTDYGYGSVDVRIWGISRFWLPRSNLITLSANRIDGQWILRGPELVDIDIRE